MDLITKVAYFFFDLLLPLAVGYFFRRQARWGESFFQRLMTLAVWLVYPALALLGLWQTPLTFELVWLPVFGLVMSVIPGVIAYFRARAKYADRIDQGSYILAAALSNTVTLGGISAFILYGESGFAYVQLITLLSGFFLFFVCFPLAQYYSRSCQDDGRRMTAASVVLSPNQLPVLGLIAGAALSYSGLPRPAWGGAIFDPLVHLGAWMMQVPVGYFTDFGEMRRYWLKTADLTLIKFAATPILTYLAAQTVISDRLALYTIFLTASTPTAIFAVIAVKLHRLNLHITMAAFVLTTAVYLLLVYPLQFWWLAGKM